MGALSKEFLDLQTALAGEYSIEGELGRGGMGVVLLARDVLLDRSVAIKVLAPHLAADPVARERFIREARSVRTIASRDALARMLRITEFVKLERRWLARVMFPTAW